jgi:hypothetical protein
VLKTITKTMFDVVAWHYDDCRRFLPCRDNSHTARKRVDASQRILAEKVLERLAT